MKNPILVTGGAGSVGRLVVEKLLHESHSVRILDLPSLDFSRLEGKAGVEIVRGGSIHGLLSESSVVITEDSTAGMEAMFWGKVLIHAHFAQSPPVMPFVEYGASLPAFSGEMLFESLHYIYQKFPEQKRPVLE